MLARCSQLLNLHYIGVANICLFFSFTLYLQPHLLLLVRTVFGCTMAQAFRHWPMFNLRPVHVGFMVDKIRFFFNFSFHLSVSIQSMLSTHSSATSTVQY